MTGRRISILVAAIFGCAAAVYAADNKVELRGSTELDLPKPKRNIDTDRKLNDQPDRPTPEGALPPGRVDNSPLLNKKVRQELDKQKNWIFMNPREQQFDSKAEEFMKGEKGTGLYGNRLMQSDDDRTMVQKFLERDQRNRDDKDDDRDNDRSDRSKDKDSFLPKRDDDDLKENTRDGGIPKSQFDTAIFKSGPGADPFGGGLLDNKMQRTPFSDSNFSGQNARALDKDELRQQQIAHEQEFNSILQSRPGSSTSFGKIDTLNPAADVGRLDIGGTSGRRSDPYAVGARGGPNIATFTDGAPSSFGNRSEIGARNFADSLPSFGAPQAGPSFAPAPIQVLPNRSSAPPPSIAPTVPMRKF